MKLAAFFSHYYINYTIKYRFNNLIKLNPEWDIYPIGLSEYSLLSDSITIDRNLWPHNNEIYAKNIDWTMGDLCVYQAFVSQPNYDIYFFIEYDTAFNIPILDFFPNIILQDCGINYGPGYDTSQNYWYKEKYCKTENQYFNLHEMFTTGPTTCLWWHKELLEKMVQEISIHKYKYNNIFSELRLGTLTKKFTTIKQNRLGIGQFISYQPEFITEKHNTYFYHPRKNLINHE